MSTDKDSSFSILNFKLSCVRVVGYLQPTYGPLDVKITKVPYDFKAFWTDATGEGIFEDVEFVTPDRTEIRFDGVMVVLSMPYGSIPEKDRVRLTRVLFKHTDGVFYNHEDLLQALAFVVMFDKYIDKEKVMETALGRLNKTILRCAPVNLKFFGNPVQRYNQDAQVQTAPAFVH